MWLLWQRRELERIYVGAHRLARVRRRVAIDEDPTRSTEGDVELCTARGTEALGLTSTGGAPRHPHLESQSSEGCSSTGRSTDRSTVTSRDGSAVESSWAESYQSGSSSLSRAMSCVHVGFVVAAAHSYRTHSQFGIQWPCQRISVLNLRMLL